jgi:hypothetical protein
MEIVGAVMAFLIGIVVWAIFCLLPAYSLFHGYNDSVGFAYFFLSTLIFLMSMTLNGIKGELRRQNEEMYRQAANEGHRRLHG